jgi:hypothetical protein
MLQRARCNMHVAKMWSHACCMRLTSAMQERQAVPCLHRPCARPCATLWAATLWAAAPAATAGLAGSCRTPPGKQRYVNACYRMPASISQGVSGRNCSDARACAPASAALLPAPDRRSLPVPGLTPLLWGLNGTECLINYKLQVRARSPPARLPALPARIKPHAPKGLFIPEFPSQ